MSRKNSEFQSIRSEGGLLPLDLLTRITNARTNLPGLKPEDYGLPPGERLNEVITQSWNRLRKHWGEFSAAAEALPANEAALGLTNDKWSLPLLRELGFGMLPVSPGPILNGRTYPISRFVGPVPIHLVGCGVSLDRRAAGVRGAALGNPHGLVQEYLNRSEHHLWAIVSNGLRIRILRDNQALSRQSFLEFDLQSMFGGEIFSDFVLLWLIAHSTRFAPRDGTQPESCWLEQWVKVAEDEGTRALDGLREGVEKALVALGQGFVGHKANSALREALRTGTLSRSDLHAQLLRIVYRLIFLFVAEDRTIPLNRADGSSYRQSLLHLVDESVEAESKRELYAAHYSMARLREMASQIKGSRHGDLWHQFQILVGALSGVDCFNSVREALSLPTLGSSLWKPSFTSALNGPGLGEEGIELSNYDFLEAVRHLAFTRKGRTLRQVDYRNLGSEEFGSVYEGLLSLTPEIGSDGATFNFKEFAGNERKTTGSYYTPDCLVQCLLDSALDPVVADRLKGKVGGEAEKALLSIKVCDPSVGSGHFLVGAAHRLARHLSRIRALASGDSEPSPLLYQQALRDVIAHCLYGVDLNPMAVELCKVTLWLEAMEPGKPLSFLDHHIQCGNSLLGVTPRLLNEGLPDEAFKPLTGDDPEVCKEAKKLNKEERSQLQLFHGSDAKPWERLGALPAAMLEVDCIPDDTAASLHAKEERYAALVHSSGYLHSRFLADAWCAAFVWKKTKDHPYPITNDVLRKIERNPHDCAPWMREEIERLRDRYQFFHWHLAFPEVFPVPGKGERPTNKDAGWNGGFDLVLGNPPWDRVKLQEKEWFSERRPEIATASNASVRKRLIRELQISEPTIYAGFVEALRQSDGESHVLRDSALFPLCGRGDINLYAVFAERMRQVLSPDGRLGAVIPSGIATDDTTKLFFGDLMANSSLVSFFEFENEGFFPGAGQGHMVRFGLTTICGKLVQTTEADFVFQARAIAELNDPDRHFSLSADDIDLLNPNTQTCPIFRHKRDAIITKSIYRRTPVLARDDDSSGGPWGVEFLRMFDMANDSGSFRTTAQLIEEGWSRRGNVFERSGQRYVPLYEAKMIQQFHHRHGDFGDANGERAHVLPAVSEARLRRADYFNSPFYWVPEAELPMKLQGLPDRGWFIGWRDVTDARASARSVIFGLFPRYGINHKFPLLFTRTTYIASIVSLYASFNSFALDYVARQKIGGLSLTYFYLKQFPVLPPATYAEPCAWAGRPAVTLRDWLLPRVLELTYTAWDLEPFARDCGWSGPPFRWDEERRFQLRCELDTAFFHLYGLSRADAAYILDTFPIVRRKDEARTQETNEAGEVTKPGRYITKETILEIYDALAEAQRTGLPYVSKLDPEPGPPMTEDGKFVDYSDIPANRKTHIHLPRGETPSDGAVSLSDLARAFPSAPFKIRLGIGTEAPIRSATPVSTEAIQSSNEIVLSHPNLKLGDRQIPAAIGKATISQRVEAATGQPFVHLMIQTTEGLAQVRMPQPEWREHRSIALLETP